MITGMLLEMHKHTLNCDSILVFSAGQGQETEIQCLWIHFFFFFLLIFICNCISVHWSAHIWRGDCHGHCLPKSEKAAHWYLAQGERRRVSGEPSSTLGSGHRHPESLTAGIQSRFHNKTHVFDIPELVLEQEKQQAP